MYKKDIERPLGPIESVEAFYYNRVKWQTPISRTEHSYYHRILSENSAFYRDLSSDGKAKAINRIMHFMRTKEFVGEGGLELNDEMLVIISFAAIKLTFGFKNYLIPHLESIHVASGVFYSGLLKAHVKGLTFDSGKMYLSWKSVKEGVADETDGLHVAVHEMAHALKIDTVKGSPAQERFAFYLNTWMDYATDCLKQPNSSGFLRAYARTNLHEFFAVCMENFVERPQEFFEQEPKLFAHTCYLLNQYPLEPRFRQLDDSALQSLSRNTGVAFPKTEKKDFTHHSWHWSLTLLMVSIFFSPFLIGMQAYDVELPVNWFMCWVICTAIAGLVFYRPVIRNKAMELRMYLPFLVFGGGPMLFAAGLFVDNLVPVYSWTETYKVKRMDRMITEPAVILTLEGRALDDWVERRTFPNKGEDIMKKKHLPMEMEAYYQFGLLGGKHYLGHELVFLPTVDGKEF